MEGSEAIPTRIVPASDNDIQRMTNASCSQHTIQAEITAANMFTAWAKASTEFPDVTQAEDLTKMLVEKINAVIPKFIWEVRKVDGKEYLGNALRVNIHALARWVKARRSDGLSIVFGEGCKKIKDTLHAKLAYLATQGKGSTKHHATLSPQQQLALLDSPLYDR